MEIVNSTALPRDFASWLNRPAPQPRKRTRIKKQSKKREAEARVYAKKRKAFLAAHPYCEAHVSISVYENPNAGIPSVWPLSTEIHHMKKPRCKYLNDESTWLAVCRKSHEWIENNKADARTLGLLL